jgi:hypothetical protein
VLNYQLLEFTLLKHMVISFVYHCLFLLVDVLLLHLSLFFFL